MSAAESPPSFESKFVEVMEQLLQQQMAADARRDTSDREQLAVLEQLQAQVKDLSQRVESISIPTQSRGDREQAAAKKPAIQPQRANGNSAHGTNAMSEWERQKQALLQDLEPSSDDANSGASPNGSTDKEGSRDPANGRIAPLSELTTHDWIEQIDPNDPALLDDNERRNFVARLRKIEVELSLERAKLARERTELDLRQDELERAAKQFVADQSNDANNKGKDRGKKDRVFRFLGRQNP